MPHTRGPRASSGVRSGAKQRSEGGGEHAPNHRERRYPSQWGIAGCFSHTSATVERDEHRSYQPSGWKAIAGRPPHQRGPDTEALPTGDVCRRDPVLVIPGIVISFQLVSTSAGQVFVLAEVLTAEVLTCAIRRGLDLF